LKRRLKELIKIEKNKNEDCNIKDYMRRKSIQDARDTFSERLSLLLFGESFGKEKRFLKYNWKSVGCCGDVPEDQAHIVISCPG
jgi:hypothetical protein